MATCPSCGEFLDGDHRCVGLWSLRARRVGGSVVAMLAGVVLATGALYIITDRPPAATVAIGVMTGMIVGQAVWTAVRR